MPMTYDRKDVFDGLRGPVFHGVMDEGQVSGLDAILTTWERLQPLGDTRFIAYALATTNWETGHTMRPIEEIGHGRGRAYGVPAGPWHEVYDGRGDVQLTWEANYHKATTKLRALGVLNADEDMVKTPALAMRPDVAAAVMIYGMVEGWFTGRKLADYFHGTATDWVNARRIINGTDQAETIATIAEHVFATLRHALVFTNLAAPVATAVAAVPVSPIAATPVTAPEPVIAAGAAIAPPVPPAAVGAPTVMVERIPPVIPVAAPSPAPAAPMKPSLFAGLASFFGALFRAA